MHGIYQVIAGIYLRHSKDMTIWFIYLVSTMFTINGFVPYWSRYWIHMSYDRYTPIDKRRRQKDEKKQRQFEEQKIKNDITTKQQVEEQGPYPVFNVSIQSCFTQFIIRRI